MLGALVVCVCIIVSGFLGGDFEEEEEEEVVVVVVVVAVGVVVVKRFKHGSASSNLVLISAKMSSSGDRSLVSCSQNAHETSNRRFGENT